MFKGENISSTIHRSVRNVSLLFDETTANKESSSAGIDSNVLAKRRFESGKTDPNEREFNTTVESNNIAEDNVRLIVQEKKRARIDMNMFVKNYMLTILEHKIQKGYFDIHSSLLNFEQRRNDDSVTEVSGNNESERCALCLNRFEEGDDVAINDSCLTPHCLHIDCFIYSICGKHTHPTGTICNTLYKTRNCPQCDKNYGCWREWKFTSTCTANWKNGRKVPDGKKVLGIHQYRTKRGSFAHFITKRELFFSIKHATNNNKFGMYKPSHMSWQDVRNMYSQYEWANKGMFKCFECKKKVYNWKKCFLIGCEGSCDYRFCRDCFIDRITNEEKTTMKEKYDGILECRECKTYSRAYFTDTENPCSGTRKTRKTSNDEYESYIE